MSFRTFITNCLQNGEKTSAIRLGDEAATLQQGQLRHLEGFFSKLLHEDLTRVKPTTFNGRYSTV